MMANQQTPPDYVIAWVDSWLSLANPGDLTKWRKYYGEALESWNFNQAQRLIGELRKQDLGITGQAHIHMGRAGLLLNKGDWKRAEAELLSADELFSHCNDPLGWTWVLLTLGNYYSDRGNWSGAESAYQRALTLHKNARDTYGEAQTWVNLAAMYYVQAKWQQATEAYKTSLDIFLEVGDSLSAAMSLSGLGNILSELGKYEEALECYDASLNIFTEAKNINGQISTFNNIGKVQDAMDDHDNAIVKYAQSLSLAQEYKDLRSQAIALDNMGVSFNEKQEYVSARHAHLQAAEIYRELGDPNESASLNHLGNVYRATGELELAEWAFNQSLQIKEATGDVRGQASVQINLALLRVKQDRWEELKQIIETLEKGEQYSSFSEPLATAEYLLGLYYAVHQKPDRAAKHWVASLTQAADFHLSLALRLENSLIRFLEQSKQGDSLNQLVKPLNLEMKRLPKNVRTQFTGLSRKLASLIN